MWAVHRILRLWFVNLFFWRLFDWARQIGASQFCLTDTDLINWNFFFFLVWRSLLLSKHGIHLNHSMQTWLAWHTHTRFYCLLLLRMSGLAVSIVHLFTTMFGSHHPSLLPIACLSDISAAVLERKHLKKPSNNLQVLIFLHLDVRHLVFLYLCVCA